MKRHAKIFLCLILLLGLFTTSFIIKYNQIQETTYSIIVYNNEQYEIVNDWSLSSANYIETTAQLFDENMKKSKKISVKRCEETSDNFILANIHNKEILFHKKSHELPSYLDYDNVADLSACVDGKYISLSQESRNRFLGYLSENYERSLVVAEEYTLISPLRVTYKKDGIEWYHHFGSIVECQGNYAFMASEQSQLALIGSIDFVFLPFNPILDIQEK